jgi:hypothetical protein
MEAERDCRILTHPGEDLLELLDGEREDALLASYSCLVLIYIWASAVFLLMV